MEPIIRKPLRLKGYDYSEIGAYFITICTKNKEKVLSVIKSPYEVYSSPEIILTDIGNCVKNSLDYINKENGVIIDKYVIMPNHIHLIVFLENTDNSIFKIINRFKSFTAHNYRKPLWQKSYYDHIIRNEKDYLTKWKYIDDNPAKWTSDEYY